MSDARLVDLFGFQRPVATWREIEVASSRCKASHSARRAWFVVAGAFVGWGAVLTVAPAAASALTDPRGAHLLILAVLSGMFCGILAADWSAGRSRRSFSGIDSRTMVAFVHRSAKTPQHGLICRRFNEIETCRPLLQGDLDAACALLQADVACGNAVHAA